MSRVEDIFEESGRVLAAAGRSLPEALERAIGLFLECLDGGGKILICGNGGSAADAQHLAAELVGRVRLDRAGLAAIALTTDSSALTAIGNDYGFERIFARQVEALARPGDLLVAISTSGRSPNVVEAAKSARDLGCRVVALTGEGGGDLGEAADVLLAAPSAVVSRIQEIHAICVHALAEVVEETVHARSQGRSLASP